MMESYRCDLDVDELLREVARLLRAQRRADALLCRYLADLADGLTRWPGLALFYGDVHQLARYKLGLSLRSSRERVRVGRALRQLPLLCAALMDGDLPYSRVREVTRVARPYNERQWLQAARDLSMRQLEQRVVAAGSRLTHRARPDSPAPSGPYAPSGPDAASGIAGASSTSSRPVASGLRSLHLPKHVWVLLERAMRGARDRSPQPLTDVEAVECVVRAALAQQAGDQRPRRAPRHQARRTPLTRREAMEHHGIDDVPRSETQPGTERPAAERTEPRGRPRIQRKREGHQRSPGQERGTAQRDESDQKLTTQSGSARWGDCEEQPATQSGPALAGATSEGSPTHFSQGRRRTLEQSSRAPAWESVGCRRVRLSSDAKQLLDLIKGGKLWNMVTLSCETGMSLPRLTVALTDLELARRVSRDAVGFYEAVAGEGDDDGPFPDAS